MLHLGIKMKLNNHTDEKRIYSREKEKKIIRKDRLPPNGRYSIRTTEMDDGVAVEISIGRGRAEGKCSAAEGSAG